MDTIVSRHQPYHCSLNRLFGCRSNKTSKLRVTGLCVRGIHRGPVNSPHKWPVTRKMFPFDDVIMHGCSGELLKCHPGYVQISRDNLLLYRIRLHSAGISYPIRRLIVKSREVSMPRHDIDSFNYCIAFTFNRRLDSSAAKFQTDRTILNTNLTTSGLCESLWW